MQTWGMVSFQKSWKIFTAYCVLLKLFFLLGVLGVRVAYQNDLDKELVCNNWHAPLQKTQSALLKTATLTLQLFHL